VLPRLEHFIFGDEETSGLNKLPRALLDETNLRKLSRSEVDSIVRATSTGMEIRLGTTGPNSSDRGHENGRRQPRRSPCSLLLNAGGALLLLARGSPSSRQEFVAAIGDCLLEVF
jgi:hypothetical protein